MNTNFLRRFREIFILGAVFLTAPFFYFRLYLKKAFLKNKPSKRILIIDNAKIGDLICATPVFRAIKEKYADSYLAVLAVPRVEEILQNNQNINELIIFPLNSSLSFKKTWELFKKIKSEDFNVCINLVPGTLNFILPFLAGIPIRITSANSEMGFFYKKLSFLSNRKLVYQKNSLSVKHYLGLLEFIGVKNSNLTKEVFTDDLSQNKVADFLAQQKIKSSDIIVGLSLSAGNKIKEWGANNFAKLADEIIKKYSFKIVAIGSPADELVLKDFQRLVKENVIITYKDFSLKELPSLIKRFNYFISVDTGPLFIANALGVPVVDIVGPFNYVEQAPYYEKCEIVKPENIDCWPCLHIWSSSVLDCQFGHYQCLKKTTPEMVLRALEALIRRCH
ncbi:MAG TPA: glycosyltransferase family 9 protein [Candidatus Portnoybacteria bacterium]|nr:glycosyltransferase family 9 protein [Candidatus Portnoybacteria bacterium]